MALSQRERADLLKSLHIPGSPLILFNIWDAGSARAMQEIGAKAIATGSWSVAAAHGFYDGEKLPLDLAVANAKRIVASVDLPVTIDFEAGYGRNPETVQQTATRIMETGAVGVNFEDQIIGENALYSIEDQCARIQAIRKAADQESIPLFINARTDIFLKAHVAEHNDTHLQEAILRANAYADSGASGFFAPGLRSAALIQELCEVSPLPVNILVFPDTPSSNVLADLGVARISYGPRPYRQMIETLKEAARLAIDWNPNPSWHMISYTSKAYRKMEREAIAEAVRKEGFDPILVVDSPGFVYTEHDHPETKVLVFLKGSMRVTAGGQSFQCVPGDKLIIPGNIIHSAIVGEDGCTFFWSEKLLR